MSARATRTASQVLGCVTADDVPEPAPRPFFTWGGSNETLLLLHTPLPGGNRWPCPARGGTSFGIRWRRGGATHRETGQREVRRARGRQQAAGGHRRAGTRCAPQGAEQR